MKKSLANTDELEILIGWLGQGDALHECFRRAWGDPHRVAAIAEAQEMFAIKGLLLRESRGSGAEQKRVERMHDSLESAGVAVFHRARGRRTHVKLADGVEWKLRSMVTWTDWPQMLVVMMAVAAHERAGHVNSGFVPDWDIAGVNDQTPYEKAKRLILLVEEYALPGLVRGLLTSWSDIQGANGYSLTDEGRGFLRSNPEPPDLEEVEYDSRLNDIFLESLKAGREWVKTLPPHQAVAVPLSAGTWPDAETLTTPPIFDRRGKVRSVGAMAKAIQRSIKPQKEGTNHNG